MVIDKQDGIKTGDYFYTSWGYDQTNIDYLIIVDISQSGKTAKCQMVSKIKMGEDRIHNFITPGVAYGREFMMRVKDGRLRGAYPYIYNRPEAKRLDTFLPIKFGNECYETKPEFGH